MLGEELIPEARTSKIKVEHNAIDEVRSVGDLSDIDPIRPLTKDFLANNQSAEQISFPKIKKDGQDSLLDSVELE